MMTAAQWMLLALGAVIVLSCWLRRNLDAPEDQPYEVCFGGFFQGVCAGWFVFCALMTPFAAWTGVPEAAWAMLVFALCFAVLSPISCLQSIRYGEGGVTIRTYFGVTHELRWEDVTGIAPGRGGYVLLCTTFKRFVINPQMPGYVEFAHYVLHPGEAFDPDEEAPVQPS